MAWVKSGVAWVKEPEKSEDGSDKPKATRKTFSTKDDLNNIRGIKKYPGYKKIFGVERDIRG